MQTLETPRLILRDWQEEDLDCGVHEPDTIRLLIRWRDSYALVLRLTGRVIGAIGVNDDALKAPDARNVGVFILPPYEGQGLMTEAVQALIAAPPPGVRRLSWLAASTDGRSLHLAQKLGFRRQQLLQIDPLPDALVYHTLDISEDTK